MPEDLLLELEKSAPAAESLSNIQGIGHEPMRHEDTVAPAIEGMQGSAVQFERIWAEIVIEVAKGQTTAMQASRPRVLQAFEKRLRMLKDTHAVATWLRTLGSTQVPDPDVLLGEITRMERLK